MVEASTQQQAKVKTPLHLRLTAKDWEECCKMLNYAEMKVFIWIRASDPYGNRELKFSCSKLGEKLGLHKSSVSRALKTLDSKQLIEIDFEDVRVTQKVSNRRLTLLCKEENESEQEQEEEIENVAPMQRRLCGRNTGCVDATSDAPMQQQVRQCNDQHPKPLPSNGSRTPQTIQTYSDFIKTLSEEAREIFLEFGKKKAANLPHPPELPDKWIAANFEELYKQFLASPAGREAKYKVIAAQHDWENDLRFMDWLHKAYYEGHPWAIKDETEKEDRLAFLMWAQRTNAYKGRIADEPA